MLDCFIERVLDSNAKLGRPLPILIGLALDEQISTTPLPMETHDR